MPGLLREAQGLRLRRDSLQLGHQLGIAWADTCEGLIAMLEKDYASAAPLLRRSAEALEAIPWLIDAARVRRKLAWVLAKLYRKLGWSY